MVLVKKIILLMAILASALVLNAKSKISSNEEREILNIINSYNNDKSKLESTRTGTFNQRTNELRGVWVASVINIDWPSKKGLSVESQKREYIQI